MPSHLVLTEQIVNNALKDGSMPGYCFVIALVRDSEGNDFRG